MTRVRNIVAFACLATVLGWALALQGCGGTTQRPVPVSVLQGIAQGRTGDLVVLKNHDGVSRYFGEYGQQLQRVQAVEGVTSATPFVLEGALVAKEGVSTPRYVLIKGIELGSDFTLPAVESSVCGPLYAESGADEPCRIDDVFKGSQHPGAVVGRPLAELLGVKPGDTLRVVSISDALFENPRDSKVQVGGIFETGFVGWDQRMVYVSISNAQRMFNLGTNVTGIEVKVDDPARGENYAARVESELGGAYPVLLSSELQGEDPWAQALPMRPARRITRERAKPQDPPPLPPKEVAADEPILEPLPEATAATPPNDSTVEPERAKPKKRKRGNKRRRKRRKL